MINERSVVTWLNSRPFQIALKRLFNAINTSSRVKIKEFILDELSKNRKTFKLDGFKCAPCVFSNGSAKIYIYMFHESNKQESIKDPKFWTEKEKPLDYTKTTFLIIYDKLTKNLTIEKQNV